MRPHMNDDQFTKLFTYMERRFDQVEKAHAELKTDIHRVYDLLDKTSRNRKPTSKSVLVMNRQLDRHETWIKQAAPRIGLGYDH